jgi:hypothetical protein
MYSLICVALFNWNKDTILHIENSITALFSWVHSQYVIAGKQMSKTLKGNYQTFVLKKIFPIY